MTFFKKIHAVVALLLISSIGNAYGANCDSLNCEATDGCSPCQPTCWGNGFISADLLYWRAFEGGLDRCVPTCSADFVASDGRVISTFNGKGRNPHFRWDPGFRIGAGYAKACSSWGVAAFWTHFHTHANNTVNCEENHKWKLDLDVVDAVIGYNYDFNSCVHFRPFVGVRWSKIDQSRHLGSFNEESNTSSSYCPSYYSHSSSSNDFQFSNSRNKQDFSGVGPLLGLEADWNVGCGFSVYASGAVSWLYGKYHTKFCETNETRDTASFCSIGRRIDANVAAADAAIGIRWETCLCGNMRILFQLGLEHHRYFDFNQICNYGDLSFDGVNFAAAVAF